MTPLSEILATMPRRAEKKPDDYLVESFVHVGSIFSLFSCFENQILYGRRGTGKTHLLKYLKSSVEKTGIACIEIDMRTIGSTGGMYADSNIGLTERASRLLSDTLCDIREQILDICINNELCDLSQLIPLLDEFVEQATHIVIQGCVDKEKSNSKAISSTSSAKVSASLSLQNNLSANLEQSNSVSNSGFETIKESGQQTLRIHFGALSKILKCIVKLLPESSLLILIDEWSEVPLELQPYLADMLRRIIFPVPTITVKIAVISHRSRFRIYDKNGSSIGLEVSSDASASLNLDHFMVFDSDKEQSVDFFKTLIFKHAKAADKKNIIPTNVEEFISMVFKNKNSIEEFARASEGVPRDAINIISQAAQHQKEHRIGVKEIRNAARAWYTTSKSKDINSRSEAVNLLEWIISSVIGLKRTRGFLVNSNVNDELIDYLYDSRVIHLVKQGVSVSSVQGSKFNLYSLDYGCYSHLINTKDEPQGLLSDEFGYISVPKLDNNYGKGSVLELSNYYSIGRLPLFSMTQDINLPTQFYENESYTIDYDDVIFSKLPKHLEAQKIKGTLYIPLIFAGLVLRYRQGQELSNGTEITQTINNYLITQSQNKKVPNNISRALRSEPISSEKWLIKREYRDGPLFELSPDWRMYWGDYFGIEPPI
ncbi:ORC-CDC6 family AAA ATPase [Vibrio cholerae]|uniref:ORC-CDC6 family AAA ATPase n=1 Tax=Vibrio cholerae TaxID=666 RepID=UPI00070C950E|nr:hypothetical protein [Vibrio cholerae]PAR65967.1 hypothetical protein CGT89_14965 [Vibrio cholerae]PAR73846.1 hypothetical protein CGT88_03245 [Vibrio cholerae]